MRWVMAWLENGFGCSMKNERTCTMRREVDVHLWWMMIWCVRSTKECVTTDLSQFLICPCTFLRFQGLYSMTLSTVIWVIGKCVHDGCPRCSQRSTKNSVLHVPWHFWRAITRKETAYWAILWQEVRHGFPISRLNQNCSPCTWSLLALRKGKSSSRWFQQGRSCAPYSGCPLSRIFAPRQNNKLLFIVKRWRRWGMQFKTKGAECCVPQFFCFTITLGRTLLLRLKTSSPHLGGNKWTTPSTALIWRQVIFTSSHT